MKVIRNRVTRRLQPSKVVSEIRFDDPESAPKAPGMKAQNNQGSVSG